MRTKKIIPTPPFTTIDLVRFQACENMKPGPVNVGTGHLWGIIEMTTIDQNLVALEVEHETRA